MCLSYVTFNCCKVAVRLFGLLELNITVQFENLLSFKRKTVQNLKTNVFNFLYKNVLRVYIPGQLGRQNALQLLVRRPGL